MKRLIIFILFVRLLACAAATSKSSIIDAGVAQSVCDHLATIGCTQPSTCVTIFVQRQGTFTDFKPSCLLAATNTAQVTACGTVSCQ
jgi:hypothetical protein